MSTSTTASLWQAFREDPTSEDLYLPDTHIVFLPTGAGAASEQYVREFFKSGAYSHPKKLLVEEKVIHRTVGESSAVDEVEVTVKFVSGAGGWLLPGIEPHHLEDLSITFPLVICASIVEDRIASVRYLWDNASVLKMVKLIGSRHSWPIVAETQVEGLRDPTRFRLNPFGGSRSQIGISKIFGSPPVSPPQAAPKKGHPALTSTVFSHLKNDSDDLQRTSKLSLSPSNSNESITTKADNNTAAPLSPQSPQSPQSAKKGHPALTSTLFNHLKDQPQVASNRSSQQDQQQQQREEQQRLRQKEDEERGAGWRPDYVKPKGHPALTSSIFSKAPSAAVTAPPTSPKRDQEQQQQQQQQEEERGAGWRADYVKPKGHPAMRSSIFSQAPPTAPTPNRSSSKHEQQEQQEQPDEERGAGWRADYVKPKGHPALTSSIFSQQPTTTTTPTPSRPFKKTSHNIFGAPAEESAKPSKPTIQEEQPQPQQYTLEPSALEDELECHDRKEEVVEKLETFPENTNAETLDQPEKQEELNQEKELEVQLKEEQKELQTKVESKSPVVANAPLSPLSPTSPTRRVHPNYRTTFTLGGPR
ncbi:hypothetical protein BGZ80_004580 [Entomortierella chlamydospora]|uniref:Uncharacterized protein n=1 Tax=Entomortierella chlamydospora TaxID=101097 RepID=A0A9P6N035_9FUNG|nr:hypothetical protein BGZ79_000291 [Entomortierella chlamydospora]KAG0020219.1 hypothetical protein BGZ80_004580 [Entomortierella chlamydospora]